LAGFRKDLQAIPAGNSNNYELVMIAGKDGEAMTASAISGAGSSHAFITTTLLGNAATYDSGVIDLQNYTQVQTDILSAGIGGTITLDFVRDAAGADILRTLTIPYVADSGYKTFSSLAFTPFVRYRFTTDGAGQTDFYFDTKVTSVALSPQILGLDDFISEKMVALISRAIMTGKTEGGTYLNVPVTSQGKLQMDIPLTAFGEVSVAEKTPQVQIKFAQGLNTDVVRKLTNKTGSTVATANGLCTVTVAGLAESFSRIRSLDVVRYGPGQGMDAKFTAGFSTGLANSSLWAGPGDDDEMLGFGFNGTSFGILHRSMGELETRDLTITGAATGTGTITIIMDGTSVPVEVTSGDNIAAIAAKIVLQSDAFFNAGRGWEAHTDDSISVTFTSMVAENASGTFSFTDTDTTGVTAGTFNQSTTVLAGAAPTEDIVAQASWNIDVMDGTGVSGMTLDPNKLNVYNVNLQYLGAGNLFFAIENPATGRLEPVHMMLHSGTGLTPTFRNPTFHLTAIAKTDAGFSGAAQTIITSSMAGFIEGKETDFGVRHAAQAEVTTNGTTEVVNLVVHNEEQAFGTRNKVVIYPDQMSLINASTKAIKVELFLNPTHINAGVTLAAVDANTSVILSGAGSGTHTGGTLLYQTTVTASQSKDINISHLNLRLRPTDTWVFVVTKLTGGSDGAVTVGLTWLERI
jgi:hypothetical protein